MSNYPAIGTLEVTDKNTAAQAAAYLVAFTGTRYGDEADRVSAIAQSLQQWIDRLP